MLCMEASWTQRLGFSYFFNFFLSLTHFTVPKTSPVIVKMLMKSSKNINKLLPKIKQNERIFLSSLISIYVGGVVSVYGLRINPLR